LTTTVDLDTRHRPESIAVPGVWSWQATNYDGNDNLLALTNSFDTYAYGYDARNRLIDADSAAQDIDYQYDQVGNRTAKTVNAVVEVGAYEAGSNRIASYANRDFTLDANGNTVVEQLNLNPDKTFVYSAHNRLVEAVDDQSASTIATYRYDALGQRVSKVTASETRQFVYGQNGELLAILDGDDTVLHEYVYLAGTAVVDLNTYPIGQPPSLPPEVVVDESAASVYGANWQAKSSASAVSGTYLQNRKQADRSVIWDIDQDPNFPAGFYDVYVNWLAQDGTQTTYFVTWAAASGGFASQQIDVPHAGHSPGDWVHLGTFEFQGQDPVLGPFQGVALWGNENNAGLLGTFLLADAVKAVPILNPLDLVDLRFIHGDHLGTPQVVTDEAGTVVWNASYLPFGAATVDEDPDGDLADYELSLRFPGQYEDAETGLNYNYFRDYDPSIGRYIESDPAGLEWGINIFEYSSSNPLKFIDPTGLCSLRVDVSVCLEEIFGERVDGVEILRRSGDTFITTRVNKIFLPQGFFCDDFQSSHFLLLHEYYHVLRQWNTGELTRLKYLIEAARHGIGYNNKYERVANDFARENEEAFRKCLDCEAP
jgi:RHS repeat-associated protein